jgi:hypothetical protein
MVDDLGFFITERTPTYQEAITSLSAVLVSTVLRVDIEKEDLLAYVSDLYDAFDVLMD